MPKSFNTNIKHVNSRFFYYNKLYKFTELKHNLKCHFKLKNRLERFLVNKKDQIQIWYDIKG